MKKTFSLKEALIFAFNTYCDNFVHFMKLVFMALCTLILGSLGLGSILGAILYSQSITPVITTLIQEGDVQRTTYDLPILRLPWFYLFVILFILLFIVSFSLLAYHIIKAGLEAYDNKPIEHRKFLSFDSEYFRFLGARLWLGLKVLLGFILLLVPGFYLFIVNFFAGYSLIEGKTSRIGADKKFARNLTRGAGVAVLCFIILWGLGISLAQLLPLAIFVTPFLDLVAVHIYKQLSSIPEQ